jgi:hypothetical protein
MLRFWWILPFFELLLLAFVTDWIWFEMHNRCLNSKMLVIQAQISHPFICYIVFGIRKNVRNNGFEVDLQKWQCFFMYWLTVSVGYRLCCSSLRHEHIRAYTSNSTFQMMRRILNILITEKICISVFKSSLLLTGIHHCLSILQLVDFRILPILHRKYRKYFGFRRMIWSAKKRHSANLKYAKNLKKGRIWVLPTVAH